MAQPVVRYESTSVNPKEQTLFHPMIPFTFFLIQPYSLCVCWISELFEDQSKRRSLSLCGWKIASSEILSSFHQYKNLNHASFYLKEGRKAGRKEPTGKGREREKRRRGFEEIKSSVDVKIRFRSLGKGPLHMQHFYTMPCAHSTYL